MPLITPSVRDCACAGRAKPPATMTSARNAMKRTKRNSRWIGVKKNLQSRRTYSNRLRGDSRQVITDHRPYFPYNTLVLALIVDLTPTEIVDQQRSNRMDARDRDERAGLVVHAAVAVHVDELVERLQHRTAGRRGEPRDADELAVNVRKILPDLRHRREPPAGRVHPHFVAGV